MLVLAVGLALMAVAVGAVVYLVRLPADRPLPMHQHWRSFAVEPEILRSENPMFVVFAGLGGFGCVVVGVMQLAHLLPGFP